MTRRFPPGRLFMVTTIGSAAVLLSVAGALAQSRLGPITDSSSEPAMTRMVDGEVVALERRPDMVTMLKLDDGTSLRVTQESAGPGPRVEVGDSVVARYHETGARDKAATSLRVIELQAP